ncbi:MAG: MurR/RpiR family transcriptional regulator [Erysipelothrix sp.]
MSCIYRIKENMHTYTETEKKIADYILNNKDEVINFSSQRFAKEVDSSAAAVVRFSKKIGYKGFTHLKVELAKDQYDDDESIDKLIKEDDSSETMIRKALYSNHRTFTNTYKLINVPILEEAIDALKKARRVYLFGVGGSGVVCEDLYQKLIRIDIEARYFTDAHLEISALSFADERDVAIAISYSGVTREVVTAQKMASAQGVKTIAITQVGRSDLTKYSDMILNIPQEESELRLGSIASRFSMFAVSDLLYLGVAKENIEETRDKLVKTRQSVQSLR